MSIRDFEKKILGDTKKVTKEDRENLREIMSATIIFKGRGVPLMEITKAVKESWDEVLEKKEESKFTRISYWGARTRALKYLLPRKEFVRPSDDSSVLYPELYEDLPRHVMEFLKSIDKDHTIRLGGSMAVLWIKNELSGFIDGGEFCVFNNPEKGAQAIADVMMVKGYQDVEPATHVLYSDTRSNLAENKQRLFKDAGVVRHHLFEDYDKLGINGRGTRL